MRRVRMVRTTATGVLLVGLLAAPAMANITQGAGLCEGSATIDGVTYTPENDSADDPIIVPPGDLVVGYTGRTTFDNNGHAGSVSVDLGGVPITVGSWKDENGDLPNDPGATGEQPIADLRDEVPFELRGLYKVSGRHTAGGNTCAGFAMVKFDGAVMESPIAVAAVADLLLGLLLLILAAVVTAGNAAAGRVRGRPVLGAIAGLLFGLGLSVLLQQFSIRPLDALMLFGVPLFFLLVGLLLGLFPLLGRGRAAAVATGVLDLAKAEASEPIDLTQDETPDPEREKT